MSVRARWLAALFVSAGGIWLARSEAVDRCLDSGGRWVGGYGCELHFTDAAPAQTTAETPPALASKSKVDPIPTEPRERTRGPIRLRLVDSTHWEVEMGMDDSGDLWRVEVTANGKSDTIPGILVVDLPIFRSDSELTGLQWNQGDLISGFRYRPGAVAATVIPLIEAIRRRWIAPELSPDGRSIAYWALIDDGEGRVEVADWPGQGVVRRGPIQVVGGGDASPGVLRWIAADTVEYGVWAEGGRVLKGKGGSWGFGPVDTTQGE